GAMNYLNRNGSPMLHFDTEVPLDQDTHKKIVAEYEKQSQTRSPFQIGSVELISQRIGKLDRKLKEFTPDDVSKESLFVDDIDVRANMSVEDIVTDFGLPNSERVKKIEKISMQKKTSNFYSSPKGAQNDRPQFVELCQFPGYNQRELTPLPCGVQPVDILIRVMAAQPGRFSSQYKAQLDRCFLSEASKAVLQDAFWHHFLDHYGQDYDKPEMPRFYNRIAHNYSQMLFMIKVEHFRDAFLKSYPSLLSQAVYSAYCNAFPHSYSKFQAEFKEGIVCLVHRWLTGLQPRCRLWLDWNKDALEPSVIRHREELLKAESEKKDTFQLLDKALVQSGSSAPNDSATQIAGEATTSAVSLQQQQGLLQSRSKATNLTARSLAKSGSSMKSPSAARLSTGKKESHPLGPGPTERHLVFNTNGRSPMVRQFLSRHRLLSEAGTDALVGRLELRDLPAMDAPTYAEFLATETQKQAAESAAFRAKRRRGEAALLAQQKRHIEHSRALDRARDALLADRGEVGRLADLILRESQRQPDDEPVGAAAAVETALIQRSRRAGAAS
ncbi:hypothetical protein BOX15_Mlig010206g3, partial [Macrostomum lignano]